MWYALTGALICGVLCGAGTWVSRRWLEVRPRRWEVLLCTVIGLVLGGWLAAGVAGWRALLLGVVLVGVLVTASLVDLHERIIPNEVVLFALLAGAVLQYVPPVESWLYPLWGLLFGFGLLFLLAVVYRGGMGMGDVKLAAAIGLFLGWPGTVPGLLIAFVFGGLTSIALLLTRRVGRKDHIPFGPFLAAGAIVQLLYGDEILRWWLGI